LRSGTLISCKADPPEEYVTTLVVQAFRAFDKDHSGKMSVVEFQTVMRNFGEVLNDDEVDQLLTAAQDCEDSPGIIDYRKLTRALLEQ